MVRAFFGDLAVIPQPVIYVVDDEEFMHDLTRRAVDSIELSVECFLSGREFLAAYDASRVGCLLTDLRMPDMTGQELLEALARRGALPPTIMISGHGDIAAAVRAMEVGAIGFLEKPCCMDVLRESIQKGIALAKRIHSDARQRATIHNRLATLTPEEQVTLQMIADGKPDKAIANKLDASIRTVQLRRASLMKKLQVSTRADLIRIASQEAVVITTAECQ